MNKMKFAIIFNNFFMLRSTYDNRVNLFNKNKAKVKLK